MKINDLSGRRFGRLLAVRIAPKIGRRIKWYCICDCGGSKNVLTENLKSGNTQSCGCIAKENPANTIHGLRKHPLYRIWKHIKGRCCNVNDKRYYDYGGRGVRICDDWLDNPKAFIEWALSKGWQPGLEIDKDIIPIQMGIEALMYSPEMCSVVTRKQNANAKRSNKFIHAFNETKTLSQWAEKSPVPYGTIKSRLYLGWEPEKAIMTPILKEWKRR